MAGAYVRDEARGFTLLETLVVVLIVAIISGFVLCAVQMARETARRVECQSNLRQLSLAMQSYVTAYGVFPAGRGAFGQSPHSELLPWLERADLYNAFNWDLWNRRWGTSKENKKVRATVIKGFICPSDGILKLQFDAPPNNYAGNCGTAYSYLSRKPSNGLFLAVGSDWKDVDRSRYVSLSDVSDGLSQTSAFSEWLVGGELRKDAKRSVFARPTGSAPPYWDVDFFRSRCQKLEDMIYPGMQGMGKGDGWDSGSWGSTLYDHFLTPNSPSCVNDWNSKVLVGAATAASNHPGGVNAAFADGHVQFVRETVDANVWLGLGSRSGNEAVTETDY